MARKSKIASEEQLETNMPTDLEEMVEPIPAQQIPADGYSRSRCGGALNQARQAQDLSVQDVGNKLRLSAKQIEAIEADDFASLPETTIVRGFIRNYAKLLKINAEPLLDAYTVIVPKNTQHELTVKPTTNMLVTNGDKPKASSYILIGLMLVMALAAWLFYQNYIQKPNPIKPSASIEDLVAEEPLPAPALPAAERAAELQPSTGLTLPPVTDAIPADAVVPVATVVPAPVETTPMPEGVPAATGLSKLEFNANQETWVGVVDANGKTVYDKIIFAGSRESIEAKPPLNVTVGNAGATTLRMNGKEVNLAPHSRNNVARIKIE